MGATESISEYEMGRAWTHVPAPEGVDIETQAAAPQPQQEDAPADKAPEASPKK